MSGGLVTGLAVRFGRWRLRITLPAVAATAATGWGAVLPRQATGGEPIGAAARVLAALAGLPPYAAVGLPPYAAVGVAVTLPVAVLQALVGAWLGRALAPRPASN